MSELKVSAYNPQSNNYIRLDNAKTSNMAANNHNESIFASEPAQNVNLANDYNSDSIGMSAKQLLLDEQDETKCIPIGLKWLIGLGTTAGILYAGMCAQKAFNRPTLDILQKNFSEIFNRKVSKEETKTMIDNYTQILKINDKDEFCTKLFEQVKKDYGYENSKISLQVEYNKPISEINKRKQTSGNTNEIPTTITIYPHGSKLRPLTNNSREEILKSLYREFQGAGADGSKTGEKIGQLYNYIVPAWKIF